MPNKTDRFFRIILIILAVILCLAAVVAFALRQAIATALTIKKVSEDSLLYTVENKVDYDLDKMLSSNIDCAEKLFEYIACEISGRLIPEKLADSVASKVKPSGCTSVFCKADDGNVYLARNFDYGTDGGILVYSEPENGYRSYSMCSPETLNITIEDFENSPVIKLFSPALYCIPVDGMNEKGLSISVNEVTKHPANQETENPDVFTTCLIRIILDRCATVEEAVELIDSVDVNDEQLDFFIDNCPGVGYHYLIADSSGNSVVVEFDYTHGYRTIVIERGDKDYQAITNHYVCEKFLDEGSDNIRSKERLDCAVSQLEKGIEDKNQLADVMEKCKLDPPVAFHEYGEDYFCDTKWTSIYNLTEKTVEIKIGNETKSYSFSFQEY